MSRWLRFPTPRLHVLIALLVSSYGWMSTAKGYTDISSTASTEKAAASSSTAPTPGKAKQPTFSELLGDAETFPGLFKLYKKDGKLYVELAPADLNKDWMVSITIARGTGGMPLLGGLLWQLGDEWLWQFRRVDDRIQVVRHNVRYRAAKGSPQEHSVQLSYVDSVLFSLPVVTTSPAGNPIVDLTPVFISDLPQIGLVLQGVTFAADRSTWTKIKNFKDNIELEVAATYAGKFSGEVDKVADARGVTVHVHYSICRLPEDGYQPRYADDRVGHFMTVVKDFSKTGQDDQFVRYVNRWDLRKADPALAVSPPVKPIIFWIEKTVPYKFRSAIRQGILDWNKAFEKAGFSNAVEVRQQPNDATWDPEDINYNTFRWISANAGSAYGPSRSNPLTGQLMDADIIFDADFAEYWARSVPIEKQTANPSISPLELDDYLQHQWKLPGAGHGHHLGCQCARGMAQQVTLGAIASTAAGGLLSKEQVEKIVMDGVRNVACHEVGHTLGLRHNFRASSMLTMEELSDPEKTRETGITASVMDYVPVNIAPKGRRQGDYFSKTVGPYDIWAIEYAYRPLPGGTDGELPELKKIASRCGEPTLQYATDGDADGFNPDPLVNRFDLGKDTIEWAQWRVELVNQLLPGLVDRVVEPGGSYERVRMAFALLMKEHRRAMAPVARYIGGVYAHRDHKGDENGNPPFVVVEAKKQREAVDFLEKNVLGPDAYQLPTELYNYLAPARWDHWGIGDGVRPDYPVHEVILQSQKQVLGHLLACSTLSRLLDCELKVPAERDAFTAAELLQRLSNAIFRETERLGEGKFTNRQPAIRSIRRNLQQHYFDELANLALGKSQAPSDCQTLAAIEVQNLEARLKQVLAGKAELDGYTRAHLSELASRSRKVLEARLELRRP